MINRDPDVRLFIRKSPDASLGTLTFHLLVREPAWGPLSQEYGPTSFQMAPGVYLEELKNKLVGLLKLVNERPSKAEAVQRRLDSIGTTLFRQLPKELQKRLWSLLGRAETFQILSNELEVPWELMKLQNRKQSKWHDGPFLCEAFAVTRWLHDMIGSMRLPINDIALIVPKDSQLAALGNERDDVLALAGPGRKVVEIEPTYRAVIAALQSGRHDTWHFCGHGNAESPDPNHMCFVLENEEVFQPDDINQHGESLSRHQPLVFLNACETGSGKGSLMSLGGWAPNFLEAGAGAFLGTLWPVGDEAARVFARDFYRRFLGGEPISMALQGARRHLREQLPGDPTWLAYTLFAHPFAKIREETTTVPEEKIQRRRRRAAKEATPADRPGTPPDLEIHAKTVTEGGKTHLEFRLHSPSEALEFFHQEIVGQELFGSREELRAYFLSLIERMEKFSNGLDANDEPLLMTEIRAELEGIGRQLYSELFPSELKRAYRMFRKRSPSLMLVTNEPWIPWELIKPYDDSNMDEIIDDDFLCLRYPMTRWLSAVSRPVESIRVRRVAFLADQAFPRLRAERNRLVELIAKYSGIEDLSPSEPTLRAFEGLLDRDGAELFHFGGPFSDRILRPEDLHGPRMTTIRRDRPFVFFNFNGGRVGWESRWVKDCGCGALLGPLWDVKDSLAYEFAATLYDAIGRGETFGRAAQEARRRLYTLRPGDPAWLAYTFYAHVNGRLVFGDSAAG